MRYLVITALCTIVVAQFEYPQPCFCKIGEAVESCKCELPSIDQFNNDMIYEKLQKLLKRDFFRFYRVNMDKPCPFWVDDRQCISKQCGISFCDDEVPAGLRKPAVVVNREDCSRTEGQKSNDFDPMDRTLEDLQRRRLKDMDIHDDQEDKFCEIDDEDSTDMHYVDLAKNPERYTGYKGDSAVRVWKSIYQENCFKPDMKFDKKFLMNPNNFEAITISIAAYNYKPAPAGFGAGSWFRNTKMFADRFGTKWSWEGPQRLRNVYFAYLLELRALLKAAPYLQKELFYTGNEIEDIETRQAIDELLDIIRQFPDQFDEHELFTGVEAQARELREEFRSHFVNISRIMDCVGCDKCRLWGKVQTHGMGTALKILFSDLPYSHYRTDVHIAPFQLTRNEVVSLFQSFGRYSSSIKEVNEFRKLMVPELKNEF